MEQLFKSFQETLPESLDVLKQAVLPVFGEQLRFVVVYMPDRASDMPEEASDMPEEVAPFHCDIIFVVKGRENEDEMGVDLQIEFRYSNYYYGEYCAHNYFEIRELARKKEVIFYRVYCEGGNIHNERILYDKITLRDNPHFEADMQSAFTKIRQFLAELPPFIVSELESYYSLPTVDTGKSEDTTPYC